MALTFSKPAESGERGTYSAKVPGGLTITVWDMTTSAASSDYSSGFDLQTNAGKMGLNRVVAVLDAYVRASNDTVKSLKYLYDCSTGKLRFAKTVVGTLSEAAGGSEIVDNDVVRLVVLGV